MTFLQEASLSSFIFIRTIRPTHNHRASSDILLHFSKGIQRYALITVWESEKKKKNGSVDVTILIMIAQTDDV